MQTNNPIIVNNGIVMLNSLDENVTDPRPAWAYSAYCMNEYFDDHGIMPNYILDTVWNMRKYELSEFSYLDAICNLYYIAAYYGINADTVKKAQKMLLYLINTKEFADYSGSWAVYHLLDAVYQKPDYSYNGIRAMLRERIAA